MDSQRQKSSCTGQQSGFFRENFTWTPDGKRLAYIFRGALWTVPVD